VALTAARLDNAPTSALGGLDAGVAMDASTAPPDDMVSVRILVRPEGSRLCLSGKTIGRSPFTLQLPRGEKRVYEAVFPGYVPRRIVIDGTKKVIDVGLKPDETEGVKPTEATKPVDPPKPAEAAKPADATKPGGGT
jgi:hypothetical protein